MASIEQLLQDIKGSPPGPHIAAIFDFDGTLISGYSAIDFIREQIRRGDLSPREFVQLMRAMTNFGIGNMGFSAMMAITAQFMRGLEEATYDELGETLYKKQIARRIYPESRALVRAHIEKGHTVAIISSATPYQVRAAARDLGIEHVLCTNLEVQNGKFTGSVQHPTCFGQGKVDAAETLAAQFDIDLDSSFFYSDSTDDLLLLERVGQPRALNPTAKLERIAHTHQWPVAHFGSRGRPTASQFVRSIAATSSLVTSFVAGLPIYMLTGSKRDSINFSFSLFADTASALIGLDLNVKGEKHLWSHRPAIFIFNHQSKADVVILAKLLRRDFTGVGKREIQSETPIIGKVLEMAGVVFIDRANSKNAIGLIAPLIDAVQKEGKSIVLAPEGTRTISPKLAPFKKGAFHMAMQAGVPIVPIVIRNAGDVAPKGDFVYRSATVDVEVLPPVDTSDWSTATLNDHVRDVRNMFARALGQPEEHSSDGKAGTKAKSKVKTKTQAKPKIKAKAKAENSSKPKAKQGTSTKPKRKRREKSKADSSKKSAAKTGTGNKKVAPKRPAKSKSTSR